nr:hypothetical protein GCM10020063_098460 [Dactylosporangium thailandense]
MFAIVASIQPRYRMLVLLATFAQLRFGELVAQRRRSIDLEAMEPRATVEMEDGTQVDDDPKVRSGQAPHQPAARAAGRHRAAPDRLGRARPDGRRPPPPHLPPHLADGAQEGGHPDGQDLLARDP